MATESQTHTGSTGPTSPPRNSLGVDIFLALLAIGLVAGGIGALKSYIDQRAEIRALNESGAETEATVIAVTQNTAVRSRSAPVLTISYQGSGTESFIADVTVCTEADYEGGTEEVAVVYAKDDPEAVRLADCAATIDTHLPLVFGVIFTILGVLLAWQLFRTRRSTREAGVTG